MGKENNFKYPIALRFHCTKCGLCCGDTNERERHILLLKKEAEKIATAISQPISAFAKRIKGRTPYVYEMKKIDTIHTCVFLENNKCIIYQLRPLVCRFYPFELKNVDNREYEFLCTKECPGIDAGKVLEIDHYAHLFKMAKAKLSSKREL